MVGGRYTWDSPAEEGEIDPFGRGTADLDVQLAGIEIARVFGRNKARLGGNVSLGITKYEDAGLVVLSYSGFVQVRDAFRIDGGLMHARSGRIGGMEAGDSDKTAYFMGVSFPVVSDTIRKLLEKLR